MKMRRTSQSWIVIALGGSWRPGLHAPVDPVAARFAEAHRMAAIVVKGTDLENLGRLIRGEPFKGSVILA